MGVILGSAVCPIALCITWKKASKVGCVGGALVGLAAGIIAWLATTSTLNGKVINVTVRLLFSHSFLTDLTACQTSGG
jgi:Na+(H+)/acetate symporter ActP